MDPEKLRQLREDLDKTREALRALIPTVEQTRLAFAALSSLDIAHDLLAEVQHGSR